jgi:hypothetical protein
VDFGDCLNPSAFRARLEAMARKKPDYAKEFKQASASLTKMKIEHGSLHGYYMGSGDRAESIARLRRWVEIATEHLSVEQIDQTAWRIPVQLNVLAMNRGDERGAWLEKWEAELREDQRAHRQVQ